MRPFLLQSLSLNLKHFCLCTIFIALVILQKLRRLCVCMCVCVYMGIVPIQMRMTGVKGKDEKDELSYLISDYLLLLCCPIRSKTTHKHK